MNVTIEKQETFDYPPQQWQTRMLKTAFLDTGGSPDFACLTMCHVDIPNRIIYIVGAKFWQVNEVEKVFFATIRNEIAILHKINQFDLMGCELNNFGRSELESIRREYGLKMIGINTVGKLTDKKKITKGLSMDKKAIVKFANNWRQHAIADPTNQHKLGQILFLKRKTKELQKVKDEFENFVRKDPEGIGATGEPKFGAEGSGHDDGVMSTLGNIHVIKTKIFKIFNDGSAVGAVPNKSYRKTSKEQMIGRAIGRVDDTAFDV